MLEERLSIQNERTQYTYNILKRLPTLATGQAEDLKVETEANGLPARIWLSRCGVADGAPWEHTVSAEVCYDGQWTEVLKWNGDDPLECFDPEGRFSVRRTRG
jgi:hypothetical protein